MSNLQALNRVAEHLPLLPLKDSVIFPQMIIPVFVSEDICLRAVEAACAKDRFIFLSAFRVEKAEDEDAALKSSIPAPFDVYNIGTVATVLRTRKLPDGRTKVLLQGLTRGVIIDLKQSIPYPVVSLHTLIDKEQAASREQELLCRTFKEQIEHIVQSTKLISQDVLMLLEDVRGIGRMVDLVAANMSRPVLEAQKILGTLEPLERLKKMQQLLLREGGEQKSRFTIHWKEDTAKSSREFYLREQLKALKNELAEMDSRDEVEEMREKIARAGMTPEAQQESLKQLRRLERMNQDTSEATLTRTYLDWMLELPWSKLSESKIEMHECQRILDADHYGMEKIKDRILEYIAVKKLNPALKGPILCFVGPPGVGKTSLGKSIARALGRKFARMSLGGVRDEAEIRGHRRTYVGAMPGRIIQALKNVGSKNPVLMLDEIDKLGADYKGDPASALLEVLDPEQNHQFSDHYISVPFDLSQIIFLANANRLETIPLPLRDRLEIIEMSGYSEEEKIEIAKQYIIPKVVEQCGLTKELLQFQDATISYVIRNYTKESGLRTLEKCFAALARKCARFIAENDEKGKERKPVKVTTKLTRELLGAEPFLDEDHDVYKKKIGVAVGLAYTQVGGEILEIEVKLLPGQGKLLLTGQLGEVMKESAQTALSCVHACAAELEIAEKKFTENDIHIHVPSGGIPKDGPSAGVALAVALISAFRKEALRQDVAMTGEITLQGRILAIGGVREKCLAALRSGIKRICLPEKNRSAFDELPITIRRKIDIHFVKSLQDVLIQCYASDDESSLSHVLERAENLRTNNEVVA